MGRIGVAGAGRRVGELDGAEEGGCSHGGLGRNTRRSVT